jgi:glutamate dehydrogenase
MEGSLVRTARAAWLAGALFDLEPLYDAIDRAPAAAAVRLDAMLAVRRLHELAARDLLGAAELDEPLDAAVGMLRPGVAALATSAALQAAAGPAAQRLRDAGLPDVLAAQVAAAPLLAAAPAVVRLAESLGVPPAEAAAAWRGVGQSLGIEDLRAAIGAMPIAGSFANRAKAALLADLMAAQTGLVRAAVRGADPAQRPEAFGVLQLAREAAAAPEFAGLAVATRAVAAMA